MSFFGALGGLGTGLADEGAYLEKASLQRDLLNEKNAATLLAQRERAQDRADRERENLMLRAELKGGGGKGGGMNLFDMAQQADTPEKQTRLMESVRAFQGDDAANVLGRMWGRQPADLAVNQSAGDFARFDRQADPETGANAAPVPAAYTERVKVDAEKGRIGLQRLLALVADPGKYDDFAKGEARTVGTDAVRGATDDAGLRRAGAVNMALEGKDRFAVQGDQSVDKALGTVKQTDLGNARASDERASAGEHGAKAKKAAAEADPAGGKNSTAADKIEIAKARERRMDIKDQIATTIKKREQGLMSKDEAKARLAELESQQLKYDKIIAPEAAPAPKPAASAPVKINSEAQYKALRSGARFIAPDGTTRIKP